jgi:HPt (histidine-containing phosphotransfer) domain-containing protein
VRETDDLPVIDKPRLDGLDKVLRKPELDSFVELFLADLENQRGEIAQGVERSDFAHAAKTCQLLATSADNLGAVQLNGAAKRLQDHCQRSLGPNAQAAVIELNAAARATDTALRMWLADRKQINRQSA